MKPYELKQSLLDRMEIETLTEKIKKLEKENKALRKNGVLNRQDEYVKNLKGTIQQLLKAKQKYKAESERWMGKFYTQYQKSNTNSCNIVICRKNNNKRKNILI